ncbi:MAG: acetoin utilization protein AcuC [Coriobacteriia bacterium]|nr:acetoin utilization protein AcuC [Coriobacteriia bacterium]
MIAALVYDSALEEYTFPEGHPMKPVRFRLAVGLMRAWDLLAQDGDAGLAPGGVPRAAIIKPTPASDDSILTVHTIDYLDAVKASGLDPDSADARYGIGERTDTPAFAGMHDVAALVVGSSIAALDAVLSGAVTRAFVPAGGMHHAHADRAAGFCIYNDPAIAIQHATRAYPGVRVAYVDIDAHHGDGVEEAFCVRDDVLTLSVHESGVYLYPGTGNVDDIGTGAGEGFALNVPLPIRAGAQDYELVLERIVAPALRAYQPDLIVLQGGADAHRDDPLAELENTVEGYTNTVAGIVRLADELCDGKLVMTGGGGYEPYSAVPRQWACAMAELMGADTPPFLPTAWVQASHAAAAGTPAPRVGVLTFMEATPDPVDEEAEEALKGTEAVIAGLLRTHPLLR